MHLGRFRVKRTLLCLISTILLLSLVKIYLDPADDIPPGDFKRHLVLGRYGVPAAIDTDLRESGNVTIKAVGLKMVDKNAGGRTSNDLSDEQHMEDKDSPSSSPTPQAKEELFISDLRKRSNVLIQQCITLRNELEHVKAVQEPPEGLIVDEKHHLLYCVVPKAACSSWKEFFFKIGGFAKDKSLRNMKRKRVLTYFHKLPEEKRKQIYSGLYKFLFVRHPFLRLLSAYKDKMEPNGSYERLHANSDVSTLYFWRDRLGIDIIRTFHGEKTALRMKQNRNEYKMTFLEFVRYLVEYPEHLSTQDRHWKPMHQLCYPCDIKYEFIANFETIETDSEFIRRLVKAELPEKNKHATNSSNLDYAFSYYNTIPKHLKLRLYERYKYDFMLFGYNPKPFF